MVTQRAAHAEPVAAGTYVAVEVEGQRYGLPIARLRDVFHPREITPVPLAPRGVAGLLNLRGRIVTAVDLRARLDLAPAGPGAACVAVGLEGPGADGRGDAFALLVDAAGDVLALGPDTYEPNPPHLGARGRSMIRGAHRLADGLLLVLDVDAVIDLAPERQTGDRTGSDRAGTDGPAPGRPAAEAPR